MAAAAKLMEPIERLFEEAPNPSTGWSDAELLHASPKEIAAKIVRDAEAASREWIAKLTASIEDLRSARLSAEFYEALANYISAQLDFLKLKIERNRADAEAAQSRVPPPAPLPAIRVIARGLDNVYTHQHSVLVDVYYQVMTEVWDRDPETRRGTAAATSADDVLEFFKRARGG